VFSGTCGAAHRDQRRRSSRRAHGCSGRGRWEALSHHECARDGVADAADGGVVGGRRAVVGDGEGEHVDPDGAHEVASAGEAQQREGEEAGGAVQVEQDGGDHPWPLRPVLNEQRRPALRVPAPLPKRRGGQLGVQVHVALHVLRIGGHATRR
jgi:hypothetical protein